MIESLEMIEGLKMKDIRKVADKIVKHLEAAITKSQKKHEESVVADRKRMRDFVASNKEEGPICKAARGIAGCSSSHMNS